jgi:hypothetical protein
MTTSTPTDALPEARPSTFTQYTEKDDLTPPPKTNEYADAEKNYDPKSLKFWLIVISIYLAFFLVALDRMIIGTRISYMLDAILTSLSYCYTGDHKHIWLHCRYWLVRQRLYAYVRNLQSIIWKDIPAVQYEMDVPNVDFHL